MSETPSNQPATTPYGAWSSPVSAASLTADTVRPQQPSSDGADIFWLEGRPAESGRVVLVRRTPDGWTHDLTPAPFNVRSRVHEYGGGAYSVDGGIACFCNFDDRRVYRIDVGAAGEPVPITPAGELRYGDLLVDSARRRVFAICEDHGTGAQPANRLVVLDLDGDNIDGGQVLVDGPDFVSFPTPSPDGRRFAWLQWDHPSMPWDESQICVAELSESGLDPAIVVAGGAGESVSQPMWASDDRLLLVSDRTGFWNLYAADLSTRDGTDLGGWSPDRLEALAPDDHEFAGPQWSLGTRSFGLCADGSIVCSWLDDGFTRLGVLQPGSRRADQIESDVSTVGDLFVSGDRLLAAVGYVDRPVELISIALADPTRVEVLRTATPESARLAAGFVSRPEPVSWTGPTGIVHGFLYPPRNPDHQAPDGEKPPLIVGSHGGPTGMSPPLFDPSTHYWTTRGFAVLAVNYGGSSGYGRAYRERLRGQWGIVDVQDCAGGATAMVEQDRVDGRRLAIHGGSAGGFTTLAALAFTDVFGCGASYFGVGDLAALARDTHKFESRYLDGLVGPYPARADLYDERSPVRHVDRIDCPIIVLQGRDDPVVPLNQAEEMAAAVRAKGLPVSLVVFDGEGHGFRRADSIIAATEAEAYFLSRVFGFELADPVPPIPIDNLD